MDINVPDSKDMAIPLFYMEPVELVAQSKAEGRPVFRDTEFVKIMIPGFKDISCHKVRPEDIERWPRQYQAFKEGNNTEMVIGTPITEWNGIKPSQAATCKALKVLSVEALANLPDAPLRKLGPDCYDLQRRAKEFLNSANSNSRISDLEKKLADALKTIEELKKPAEMIMTGGPVKIEATITGTSSPEPITSVANTIVTSPDGETWSGRGRKPNWVKEMEGK